jgi:hypothetical protein
MSISIDAVPLDYSSAHDDLWHVVTSNNSNAVDFKFVFDVFVGQRQLIRAKVFPNPANGTGYFNVSNIISNEMKFDWFEPNGEVFMKELNDSGEIYQSYTVRYGEDVSGITTLNMASGVTIAANCVPNLFGRRLTTTSSVFDPSVKKFYTNRDKLNIKSNYGEDLYIGGALMPSSSFLEVYQYNSAGTQLDTDNISIPASTTSEVYQLNISPDALVDAGIVFDSGCTYYEVQMWNRLPNPDVFKDKVRVYFECAPKYEVVNLHFMNNYGLFDTARFACVSRLSMDAQRKTFEKPDYNLGNSVTFYDNNTTPGSVVNRQYYESKINFGSQYQWNYKLTMNFPNDADYEWLAELVMSPQVWAEFVISSDNKEYYPVSIKATNYEYSKHINNGLRAFEVEIDMNQKRNGFRR